MQGEGGEVEDIRGTSEKLEQVLETPEGPSLRARGGAHSTLGRDASFWRRWKVGRSVRSASASRILGAVTVERSISGSLHADPGPCQRESRITPQFSMNSTLLPPPQDRGRLESRSEN